MSIGLGATAPTAGKVHAVAEASPEAAASERRGGLRDNLSAQRSRDVQSFGGPHKERPRCLFDNTFLRHHNPALANRGDHLVR
jgi:hypothetical protein